MICITILLGIFYPDFRLPVRFHEECKAAFYRYDHIQGGGGGVTDACAVCKILHVIECALGSSGFKLPSV